MGTEKKWHAVYTRPKWENKVSQLLSRRDVETYCPMTKQLHQWADRKKIIYKPLFSSYVFVHVDTTDQLTIKQTEGVLNFVYWLGKPAIIRNDEIEAIKNFLSEHENVTLEKTPVNVSDKVRILDGPLMYMEGNVLEIKNQTVKVCLPSLGCMMVAEIRKSNIEIIPKRRRAGISKTA